jgi:hypothetical protein
VGVLPDEDVDAAADEDRGEDTFLMTRTMAELYAKQGLHDRAIDVYAQLVELNPEDGGLSERIRELEAQAQGDAAPSSLQDDDLEEEPGEPLAESPPLPLPPPSLEVAVEIEAVEGVWVEDEQAPSEILVGPANPAPRPRPGGPRTISEYLGDLLAWVPGAVPIESLAPKGLEGSSVPPAPPAPAGSEPAPAKSDSGTEAGSEAGEDGDADEFDAWLRSLRS